MLPKMRASFSYRPVMPVFKGLIRFLCATGGLSASVFAGPGALADKPLVASRQSHTSNKSIGKSFANHYKALFALASCAAIVLLNTLSADATEYLPGSVLENSFEVQQAHGGDFVVGAEYGYSSQGDLFEPGSNLVRQDFEVSGGFSPWGPLWVYLSSETIANSSNRTSSRKTDSRRLELGVGAGYEFTPITVGLFAGFDRLEEPGGTPDTFKYEGATSWRIGGALTFTPDAAKHWRLSLGLGYLFDNTDQAIDAGEGNTVNPAILNTMLIRGDYRLLAGFAAVAEYDPLTGFIELYTEQARDYSMYSDYDAEFESVRFVENPIYLTAGGLFRLNEFLRFKLGGEFGLSDRLELSDGEDVAVVPLARIFCGIIVDYSSDE
jgi:hypothetical protein